jgi:Domain of unknown function (DUF4124)
MNAQLARGLLVTLAVLATALAAQQARAQAYKYKDSNGHVHFTEDYYQVPERYRGQVETREMPTRIDPNAPSEEAEPGTAKASVEGIARQSMGGNMTVQQKKAFDAWLARWMWPFIAGVVANCIIALSMVIHAFVQGRIGWGLANFFIGVSSPFYLMIHLEQSVPVRLGLLLLYLSPMIVGGMAGVELARALH